MSILERLYEVLLTRKNADGAASYVASLYAGGSPRIAEKVLEEAQEFIDEALALDADSGDAAAQANIRSEAADFLFHMMVMLAHHDVPPTEVLEVLEQRFGTSGHDEKASRS